MFAANSFLFVPGSRPDRFAKAHGSGAGLTVIDLEDAVPAEEKASARDHALAQVASGEAGWAIRMNGMTTAAGIADLAFFRSLAGNARMGAFFDHCCECLCAALDGAVPQAIGIGAA